MIAGVQGRISLGHDSHCKNYLVAPFDTFSEPGFFKSIVIFSRPKAALSYYAPTGRLAGEFRIAIGFFLDGCLCFPAAPFRLLNRGVRESNDMINMFHLFLLRGIKMGMLLLGQFENMRVRVQTIRCFAKYESP